MMVLLEAACNLSSSDLTICENRIFSMIETAEVNPIIKGLKFGPKRVSSTLAAMLLYQVE
ncbi:hypothetical protein PVAP13_7KG161700 [Panicum virgatum]|uniref:Uncharacterized protein n=1 Tax=Panicum virgatum TaxID=38727 RepID=A0A8T0QI41_PANVG|nr:hypothetical protein PVAP13_7KG161700 [Panicum virgatum]